MSGVAILWPMIALWMMRAETPDELGTAMRWAQVSAFLWIVSIAWFVRVYLGAGRPWLAWTVLRRATA